MSIIIPQVKTMSVKVDGDRIIVNINGHIESMPWQAAIQLATALFQSSKIAETHAKSESIAQDQALLMRMGANIGLSSNPTVIDEAKKLAAHDKNLRRLPTIESRSVVGAPSLVHSKKEQS